MQDLFLRYDHGVWFCAVTCPEPPKVKDEDVLIFGRCIDTLVECLPYRKGASEVLFKMVQLPNSLGGYGREEQDFGDGPEGVVAVVHWADFGGAVTITSGQSRARALERRTSPQIRTRDAVARLELLGFRVTEKPTTMVEGDDDFDPTDWWGEISSKFSKLMIEAVSPKQAPPAG